MISANGGLPAHRYTLQVTQRWPLGSEPASARHGKARHGKAWWHNREQHSTARHSTAQQGRHQILPCCNNDLQPPLRSVASLAWLWLGGAVERACKVRY